MRAHVLTLALVLSLLPGCGGEPSVSHLVGRLREGDVEAANRLGGMGPAAADAVPALRDVLRGVVAGRWSSRLGKSVAFALGSIGEAARPAVPDLLAAAVQPDDEGLHVGACLALGMLGPVAEEAAPDLVRLLENYPPQHPNAGPDPEWVLAALSGIGTEPCAQALVTFALAAHGRPNLNVKAWSWIEGRNDGAEYGWPDSLRLDQAVAVQALRGRMNRDRDLLLRLMQGVGGSTEATVGALSAVLEDPAHRPDVHRSAAEALGRMGKAAQAAVPALEEAAKRFYGIPTSDVRRAAEAALASIRGP